MGARSDAAIAAAYDAVPYVGGPFRVAHPSAMGAIARLHGLSPPDPRAGFCLDLGCGDAGAILAIAASLPDARCAGLDADAGGIERGEALRDAAGIEQVELRVADLRDPAPEEWLGKVDYVILHGVLSWVSAEVRDAAFALGSSLLSPNGVMLASYNALPGWHLLRAARRIALDAVAGSAADPDERGRAAMDALRLAHALHAEDDAYGIALELGIDRFEIGDPSRLFHDDLAPLCEPFALDQVVAMAEPHGLRFLDEALPEQWWRWRLAPDALEQLRELGGDTPESMQLGADHASGAVFKATLFVHSGQQPQDVAAGAALDLHTGARPADEAVEPSTSPAVRKVSEELARREPAFVTVRGLAEDLGLSGETTGGAVLRLVAEDELDLRLGPPPLVAEPGERPVASPLARAQAAQAAAGPNPSEEDPALITSLRNDMVGFSDRLSVELIAMLDGTRDRKAIGARLAAVCAELELGEPTAKALETMLVELAHRAILIG